MKKIKLGLKRIPNNQEMLFLKGKIYLDQKDIKSAIKYLEKSLTVNKPQIKIYICLTFCYFIMQNSEKMECYFNHAINLDGEFINAMHDDNILDKLINKYLS